MKKRIRELAEQADRWAQEMTWSADPRYGDRPKSDLFEEKFAELIVRECAGVVHLECKDFANGNCFHDDALWKSVTTEYGKNKERGFDPIGMSIHFEKILTQHFGVEL